MKTTKLPYATSAYDRQVAALPRIAFRNRYVEQNPVLSERPVASFTRPALRKAKEVGEGPLRAAFSSPSLFNNKLFVVSGAELYTITVDGVETLIGQLGTNPQGDVSWAAVANIGDIPARLFIAEGSVLWVYADEGQARGTLTFNAIALNNDTVRIDEVYYKFTNAGLDVGGPDGTAAKPWLIPVAGTMAVQLEKLYKAINETGVAGTDYSTALVKHPTAQATQYTGTALYVAANQAGVFGNAIETTETGAQMAWGAATLQNGGNPGLWQVTMPNDAGAISIAHINSFVIVVPVQSVELDTLGRFYWIQPGETFVDPLDFANAERSPDALHQVLVYGTMFWLLGQVTTEPWVMTGNPDSPMARYQSVLFDRGSWAGTAVQVKDSLMLVDEEGGVFQIAGGSQQRVSRPDIEERIRRGIQAAALRSPVVE